MRGTLIEPAGDDAYRRNQNQKRQVIPERHQRPNVDLNCNAGHQKQRRPLLVSLNVKTHGCARGRLARRAEFLLCAST